MTVGELIELLQDADPSGDRLVVMAKDSEGNHHSPLYSAWCGAYLPDSTYSGEVGLEHLDPIDIRHGYTEEDVLQGDEVVPAIILSPTN